MLRVAVVLPAYFESELHFAGGGDRYPYRLAQALRAHCDVTLISFGPRPRQETLTGLRHVVLPVLSTSADNPLPRLGFFLHERFDLIHVNQVRSATTALLAALTRLLRTPLVATDHGGGGRSFVYPLRLYLLIRRFIAQSEFSRSLLPPAAQRRACVVRGGIDIQAFGFSDAPRERRVIQIGRIMPHKGIHYLIEAAGSDIPVVVAGQVVDRAYYEHLRRISEGKQVTFVIDSSDAKIRELYATSAVTVAASVYRDEDWGSWPNAELLGLTLLESMSIGTPVICTKVGGMPEYVVDRQVGFVIPPNDPRELREKILTLLSDPRRAIAMGRAGRAHVEGLTWHRVAEQVAQEYWNVVGAR